MAGSPTENILPWCPLRIQWGPWRQQPIRHKLIRYIRAIVYFSNEKVMHGDVAVLNDPVPGSPCWELGCARAVAVVAGV